MPEIIKKTTPSGKRFWEKQWKWFVGIAGGIAIIVGLITNLKEIGSLFKPKDTGLKIVDISFNEIKPPAWMPAENAKFYLSPADTIDLKLVNKGNSTAYIKKVGIVVKKIYILNPAFHLSHSPLDPSDTLDLTLNPYRPVPFGVNKNVSLQVKGEEAERILLYIGSPVLDDNRVFLYETELEIVYDHDNKTLKETIMFGYGFIQMGHLTQSTINKFNDHLECTNTYPENKEIIDYASSLGGSKTHNVIRIIEFINN